MAEPADRAAAPEDDPLAWEAENAPRAAIFALAAAILYLGGSVGLYFLEHSGPSTANRFLTLVDTLGGAAGGRRNPAAGGGGGRRAGRRGPWRRRRRSGTWATTGCPGSWARSWPGSGRSRPSRRS